MILQLRNDNFLQSQSIALLFELLLVEPNKPMQIFILAYKRLNLTLEQDFHFLSLLQEHLLRGGNSEMLLTLDFVVLRP